MAADSGFARELDVLCELARLSLSPAEKEQIAGQLNDVLKTLGEIRKVNTSGVEPTIHPAALPVCFREDEAELSLHPDRVFENTLNRREHYFRVPRIAENGPDEG